MKITLKHKETGSIKKAETGFSWTTLFFNSFPALFRGDIKYFFIIWIVSVITLGVGWIVFAFKYNKIYITNILEKGYIPADERSSINLKNRKIIA